MGTSLGPTDQQIERLVNRVVAAHLQRLTEQMQNQDKVLYRTIKALQQSVLEIQTDVGDSMTAFQTAMEGDDSQLGAARKQIAELETSLKSLTDWVAQVDGQFDARVDDKLDAKIGEAGQAAARAIEPIRQEIQQQLQKVQGPIGDANARIDQIIGAVRTLDGRLGDLRGRLDGMQARLSQLDQQGGENNGRLDAIEGRLRALSGKVGELETAITANSAAISLAKSTAPASASDSGTHETGSKKKTKTRTSGEWSVPLLAARQAATISPTQTAFLGTSSDGDDSPLIEPFRYLFGTAAVSVHAPGFGHHCAVSLPQRELGSDRKTDVRCAGIAIAEGVPGTRFPFLGAQLICNAISRGYDLIDRYVDEVEDDGVKQPVIDLTRFTKDIIDDFRNRARKLTEGVESRRGNRNDLASFIQANLQLMVGDSVMDTAGRKIANFDDAEFHEWLEPRLGRIESGAGLLFSSTCIFVLTVRNRVLVWTLGNGRVHLGEKIVMPDETKSIATVYRLLFSQSGTEPYAYLMSEAPYIVDGRPYADEQGILPSVRVSADSDTFDVWISSDTGRHQNLLTMKQNDILLGLQTTTSAVARMEKVAEGISERINAAPSKGDDVADVSIGLLRGTRTIV